MSRSVVAIRCVRCYAERFLTPGETLCTPCIWDLANESNDAYDDVRARGDCPDPKREPERLTNMVLLYIAQNHAEHQVPHVGCSFCALA